MLLVIVNVQCYVMLMLILLVDCCVSHAKAVIDAADTTDFEYSINSRLIRYIIIHMNCNLYDIGANEAAVTMIGRRRVEMLFSPFLSPIHVSFFQ